MTHSLFVRLVKGIQMLFDGVSVADSDYKAVKENIAGIASAVSASSFKGLTLSYRNPGTKTLTDTKVILALLHVAG